MRLRQVERDEVRKEGRSLKSASSADRCREFAARREVAAAYTAVASKSRTSLQNCGCRIWQCRPQRSCVPVRMGVQHEKSEAETCVSAPLCGNRRRTNLKLL